MPELTRVEAGRWRAQIAKRVVSVTAATGFVVALALARQGHPATAQSSHNSTPHSARTSFSDDQPSSSSFGGGSISPSSGGTPPAATATS